MARLVFGAVEPAGRLPVYYNAKDSYRLMTYYNAEKLPRYRFGCGFGYTQFRWLLVEAPTNERWSVTVKVSNTGERPGWVVPQLYIHRTQGITVPGCVSCASSINSVCNLTRKGKLHS